MPSEAGSREAAVRVRGKEVGGGPARRSGVSRLSAWASEFRGQSGHPSPPSLKVAWEPQAGQGRKGRLGPGTGPGLGGIRGGPEALV